MFLCASKLTQYLLDMHKSVKLRLITCHTETYVSSMKKYYFENLFFYANITNSENFIFKTK